MQLFFGVLAPLPFTFPAMGNAFLAVATASAIFGLVFFGLRDTWPLKSYGAVWGEEEGGAVVQVFSLN